MYSKAFSGGMYSVLGEGGNVSVPPRYGGVRFARSRRSDGRDGVFEGSAVPMARASETEFSEESRGDVLHSQEVFVTDAAVEKKAKNPLAELFKNIGEDDILILSLILIIAAEKSENSREVIFLLALLLCFR